MAAGNARFALVLAALTGLAVFAFGLPPVTAVVIAVGVLAIWTASELGLQLRWTALALRVRSELRDPTGPLLGVLIGLAVLASGSGIATALAAGGAVVLVKVATGVVLRRASVPRPRLPAGSEAELWLGRADRAVEAIRRIAPARESSLAERFAQTSAGADETVVLIRRLATYEATVARLLEGIDAERVREEATRLEGEESVAPSGEIRDEIRRSLVALRDQQAARERLVATDRTLLARMRTAAVGLEGLVARLAEITVLAQGGAQATAHARVAELADELEGLRAGLSEAESLSRATVNELKPLNSDMEVSK